MDITIDAGSATPPYEQVRLRIAALAASGGLAAGEKLPPVRALAAELGLAANTVARAYKELEADRLVRTEGRNGTFVLASRSQVDDEETRAAAETFARAARRAGLSRSEAGRVLDEAW